MTTIIVEKGQIVGGDLNLILKGGKFPAVIDGVEGLVTCDENYTNVKFLKSKMPRGTDESNTPSVSGN